MAARYNLDMATKWKSGGGGGGGEGGERGLRENKENKNMSFTLDFALNGSAT